MKKWSKRIGIGVLAVFGTCLLALGIAYLAASGDYRVAPTVQYDKSKPRFQVGGVTFHGQAFGPKEAPVVIAIHGGPGNDHRYLLPLKPLSKTYRIVFYDQRGTGLSPRVPNKELTLDHMVEDLGRIARHFGKGKPVRLIGHSWGAMLAAAVVSRYPTLASHIVLAEPGLLDTAAAKAFLQKFKFSLGLSAIARLGWLWLQSRHVKSPDPSAKDDYFFGAMSKLNIPGNPMKGYACKGDLNTMYTKLWRFNLASSLEIQGKAMGAKPVHINLVKGIERYKGKALFITGSCNRIIGEAHQRKYHMKYFPGAKLHVLQNAGHTMFGEKPAASLAKLQEFLASPSP